MAGASTRPLLSGFYRMMAVALRLSEEANLFSQDAADASHLAYGQVPPFTFMQGHQNSAGEPLIWQESFGSTP